VHFSPSLVAGFSSAKFAIPLDGQIQGDIGTPGFDFRLHLLRPNKLAPHIYPAAYTVDIGLLTQRVITSEILAFSPPVHALHRSERRGFQLVGRPSNSATATSIYRTG